jgi:NADP-dependent 3-hydroxy acid dehydrogenase YdfG
MTHIVVVGASAFLGRKLALRLSPRAQTLTLVARRADHLLRVAEDAYAAERADVVALDLADPAATEQAALAVVQRHPQVDVLLNVAGGAFVGRLAECGAATLRHEVDAYVRGLTLFTTLLLPSLRRARKAVVVNLLADWVTRTGAMEGGNAVFTMTKAALASFGDCLASEEWRHGVAVSNVFLGQMSEEDDTSRIPRDDAGMPTLLAMDEVCAFIEWMLAAETVRVPAITLLPSDRSYARRRAQAGGPDWDVGA